MRPEPSLASTLASLKFVSASPLRKTALNSAPLIKCVEQFKARLLGAPESTSVSDKFLENVADCLYDLKACDRRTSRQLSSQFEQRPGIISRQLQGGVLWAYYNNPALNRRRRKVVNASCRVAVLQATREFLELRGKATNIARFGRVLRNLKVVGQCYTLPVSPKARLEQSILESGEVLRLCFECNPLLLQACSAFSSLLIDDERIAHLMLEIFCEHLQREELVPLGQVAPMLRVLYRWKIRRPQGSVRCAEVFRELLERGRYDFRRNAPATVKLLTAAVRLPRSALSHSLCSVILRNSGFVPIFCSNSDLVLFFNAVAQLKRTYPQAELPGLEHLVSNLETYLEFGQSDVTRADLVTIHRSCALLGDHANLNSLLGLAARRLESS